MHNEPTLKESVSEIRRIFKENPAQADRRIESFFIDRLYHLDWPDRIEHLKQVKTALSGFPLENKTSGKNEQSGTKEDRMDELNPQSEIISRLFPMLLGRQATTTDLEPNNQLASLAKALNTIFDTLNRLILVINTTLKGTSPSSQEETIRSLIGRSVTNQSSETSMVAYLGQIEQAFLTSQQAMKSAVREVVEELLTELDPQTTESQLTGPLKSKKTVNALKEKHRRCRQWLASERFQKRWLRAFEKSCHHFFNG